jgi:hypothetical protein
MDVALRYLTYLSYLCISVVEEFHKLDIQVSHLVLTLSFK